MSHIKISGATNIQPTGADKIPIARASSTTAYNVTVGDIRFGMLDVRSYGATGDGITDDTVAVQAAIDAGNTIYFRDGTYLCTRLTVPSNRYLLGSKNAIIKAKALNNKSVIRNANPDTGNTNIHIRGLKIDGNKAAQTAHTNPCHGIAFYYVSDSSVKDCTIVDCEQDGIYFGVRGQVESVTVGGDNTRIVIAGNYINSTNRNGVSVTRGSYIDITNNVFSGCNVLAESDPGYYEAGTIDIEPNDAADPAHHINIIGNNIINALSSGIQLTGSAATAYSDILIANNNINQGRRYGVYTVGTTVTRVTIVGNIVNGASTIGVAITSLQNVTVFGNVISTTDTTYANKGILVNDAATNVVVVANVITGFDSSVVTATSTTSNENVLIGLNFGQGQGANDGNVSIRDTNDAMIIANLMDRTTVGAVSADFYNNEVITQRLGVGNNAAATTLGSVNGKVEIFDKNGASLGYVPVYDAIT